MPRSTTKTKLWQTKAKARREGELTLRQETEALLSVLDAELATRCAELGLKLTQWGDDSPRRSSLSLSGGKRRALHLSDGVEHVEIRLRVGKPDELKQMIVGLSEDLMLLPEHAGIIQAGKGYIEAIIEDINAPSGGMRLRPYTYHIDPHLFAPQDGSSARDSCAITFAPDAEGTAVEISPPSALFEALDAKLSPPRRLSDEWGEPVTLKVSGAKLRDEVHGSAVLEAVADSCSIGLEARFGKGFALSPRFDWKEFWDRDGAPTPERSRPEAVRQPLPLALNEYADKAVSFYWDARKLENVPIHAYNAYYKVLEYHFQRYAAENEMKLIRRQLRDPRLNLNDDHDLSTLVAAVRDHARKRNSKEELVAMTLASCIESRDLAGFIASDTALSRHLVRRDILPGIPAIPKTTRRDELVKRVAERLSKLRNQTVHAEGEIEDGRNLLLVPGSPAALSVSEDVKLIRHCALAVIIASSRSLDLKRL